MRVLDSARAGDAASVREALRHGGNPNEHIEGFGWRPLHYACDNGHVGVVEELLSHARTDVDAAEDGMGATPLLLAVDAFGDADLQAASARIVALLVRAGADVNLTDSTGTSPLHVASKRQNVAAVRLLLLHRARPSVAKESTGQTPMHQACLCERSGGAAATVEIIEALAAAGADLDSADRMGYTPLHCCAVKGSREPAEALLHLGADASLTDFNGLTPAELARRKLNVPLSATITSLNHNLRRYWLVRLVALVARRRAVPLRKYAAERRESHAMAATAAPPPPPPAWSAEAFRSSPEAIAARTAALAEKEAIRAKAEKRSREMVARRRSWGVTDAPPFDGTTAVSGGDAADHSVAATATHKDGSDMRDHKGKLVESSREESLRRTKPRVAIATSASDTHTSGSGYALYSTGPDETLSAPETNSGSGGAAGGSGGGSAGAVGSQGDAEKSHVGAAGGDGRRPHADTAHVDKPARPGPHLTRLRSFREREAARAAHEAELVAASQAVVQLARLPRSLLQRVVVFL